MYRSFEAFKSICDHTLPPYFKSQLEIVHLKTTTRADIFEQSYC